MPYFEYKVVPAPDKTPRVKGLKGSDRFAYTLETILCDMGAEGWEYIRAETFADTERKAFGLAAKTTVTRNVLIFRREIVYEDDATAQPEDAGTTSTPAVEESWAAPAHPATDRRLVADPAHRADRAAE